MEKTDGYTIQFWNILEFQNNYMIGEGVSDRIDLNFGDSCRGRG